MCSHGNAVIDKIYLYDISVMIREYIKKNLYNIIRIKGKILPPIAF